jgi:hypothetical protein
MWLFLHWFHHGNPSLVCNVDSPLLTTLGSKFKRRYCGSGRNYALYGVHLPTVGNSRWVYFGSCFFLCWMVFKEGTESR